MDAAYAVSLAAYLLAAPSAAGEVPPRPEDFPALRDAVHLVAIQREILDPRECGWFLNAPENFVADLIILRRRAEDLRDAPPAADSWRVPAPEVCAANIRFNRAFRSRHASMFDLEPTRDELAVVLHETDRLYEVWDLMRDARSDFLYIPQRRAALLRIKVAIGAKAFAAGEWPQAYPAWRIEDAR